MSFTLIDLGGLAAISLVAVKVLGPVASALAKRLEGGERVSDVPDPDVHLLRDEVEQLQERLDFLERAVGSRQPPVELPPLRTPV